MRNGITSFVRLLILLLVMSPLGALARVVGVDQAARVAATFLRVPQTRGGDGVRLAWHSGRLDRTTRAGEEPLFYVFEPTSGRGFVVVSGDDRVRPVLAYSLQGAAPQPDRLPDGLAWWIDNVSAQIRAARQSAAGTGKQTGSPGTEAQTSADAQGSAIAKMWAGAEPGNVVVQLETAEWNQYAPYNLQCPMFGGEYCLTGCGPTAAAIIMRYHRWPERGRGTTEAYTGGRGVPTPARDLNHKYDWDNMPMIYESGYSEAEAQAVSTLMADIGHAAHACYAAWETSSYISEELLYKYFDYDSGMYWALRENRTDDHWFGMLKAELDAERPVLYSGQGTPSGHYFVFDGYSDDDYFHVNWGWGGYCNGFFTLSALDPYAGYSYNEDQRALLGMQPNTGQEPEDWLYISDNIKLDLEDGEVERGVPFAFSHLEIYNLTQLDFVGSIRVCLVDREGKVKEVVSDEDSYKIYAQSGITGIYLQCTITVPIDFGDRLRVYYKSKNSFDWHLVKPWDDSVTGWQVPVADEYNIAESTSLTFDRPRRIITLSTKKGVSARLLSQGGEDLSSHLSIEGTTLGSPVSELPAGSCTVRLTKGADTKELSFSVKPYTR